MERLKELLGEEIVLNMTLNKGRENNRKKKVQSMADMFFSHLSDYTAVSRNIFR
jgi:hypothetical protein